MRVVELHFLEHAICIIKVYRFSSLPNIFRSQNKSSQSDKRIQVAQVQLTKISSKWSFTVQ